VGALLAINNVKQRKSVETLQAINNVKKIKKITEYTLGRGGIYFLQ
jgi:hypothetical protein